MKIWLSAELSCEVLRSEEQFDQERIARNAVEKNNKF